MTNDKVQEVKQLREVPRQPVCCGQPMKTMVVGATSGSPRKQYVCLKCSSQQRGPELNPKSNQTTQPKETVHG